MFSKAKIYDEINKDLTFDKLITKSDTSNTLDIKPSADHLAVATTTESTESQSSTSSLTQVKSVCKSVPSSTVPSSTVPSSTVPSSTVPVISTTSCHINHDATLGEADMDVATDSDDSIKESDLNRVSLERSKQSSHCYQTTGHRSQQYHKQHSPSRCHYAHHPHYRSDNYHRHYRRNSYYHPVHSSYWWKDDYHHRKHHRFTRSYSPGPADHRSRALMEHRGFQPSKENRSSSFKGGGISSRQDGNQSHVEGREHDDETPTNAFRLPQFESDEVGKMGDTSAIRDGTPDLVFCGKCHQRFSCVEKLKLHQLRHDGCRFLPVPPRPCHICAKENQYTELECAFCLKDFPSSWSLLKHVQISHQMSLCKQITMISMVNGKQVVISPPKDGSIVYDLPPTPPPSSCSINSATEDSQTPKKPSLFTNKPPTYPPSNGLNCSRHQSTEDLTRIRSLSETPENDLDEANQSQCEADANKDGSISPTSHTHTVLEPVALSPDLVCQVLSQEENYSTF